MQLYLLKQTLVWNWVFFPISYRFQFRISYTYYQFVFRHHYCICLSLYRYFRLCFSRTFDDFPISCANFKSLFFYIIVYFLYSKSDRKYFRIYTFCMFFLPYFHLINMAIVFRNAKNKKRSIFLASESVTPIIQNTTWKQRNYFSCIKISNS